MVTRTILGWLVIMLVAFGPSWLPLDASAASLRSATSGWFKAGNSVRPSNGNDLVIIDALEFTEDDTDPACGAGSYNLYADLSETAIKVCQDGVTAVLGTGGAGVASGWVDDGTVIRLDTITDDVGIGTTSPLKKLDVVGSTRIQGTGAVTLTGSIDPAASTAVVGVGTLFTTELVVGDQIVVTGENRTVTVITDTLNLTVDEAFSDNADDTSPDKIESEFVVLDASGNTDFIVDADGVAGIMVPAPKGEGLHIQVADTGFTWTPLAGSNVIIEGTDILSILTIIGDSTTQSNLFFADEDSQTQGRITYNHGADSLSLFTAGKFAFFIDNAQNLSVGVNDPDRRFHVEEDDAVTTAVTPLVRLSHTSSGTAAVGFGAGLEFELEGADGTNLVAGSIDVEWTDAATGVEDSDMVFSVATAGAAAAEVARFTSTGRLGVKTDAPDATLHVHTATAGAVTISGNADDLVVENNANAGISIISPNANDSFLIFGSPTDSLGAAVRWNQSGGLFQVGTDIAGGQVRINSGNGTEAIRIDGSQRVGIGIVSPLSLVHLETVDTAAYDAASLSQGILRISNNVNGAVETDGFAGINLYSSVGSPGVVTIGAAQDGANSAGFIVATRTSGVMAERIRVTSGGNFGIGDVSPVEATLVVGAAGAGNIFATFAAANADTLCWDAAGASLITDCTSLREHKENIIDLPLGLSTVMQLQPRQFDWKKSGQTDLGFIAEEVEIVSPLMASYARRDVRFNKSDVELEAALAPDFLFQEFMLDSELPRAEAVKEWKREKRDQIRQDEDEEKYLGDWELSGVKYRHMIALLVKAIQEQQVQIQALQATVNP